MAASDRSSSGACPSDGELIDFSRGHVAAALAEAIGEHLSDCTRCAASLASLADAEADADGSIIGTLRRSLREPAIDPYSSDPECQRMTQWAKGLLERPVRPPPGDRAGAAEPALPWTLGQYQLVAKIGEGGMGTVYRALHTRLKKPVAVKVLRVDRTADRRAVARFQREMEAIGRLDHTHIVRATDAGEADGVHFLVMELVDGINLAQLVAATAPLGAADACAMIRQAALGLQCAHEHRLVHRDVKPSNLLLSARGEIKILDLGLARLQEEIAPADELTASHHILGTGDYMAPEQWQESHAVDIRADIYSLGCTLAYLLTGAAPFGGRGRRSLQQKMSAHLHADLPSLRGPDGASLRGLQSIFERMLAKDASERYADPAELADALMPFCSGADLPALARRGLTRQAGGPTHASDSTGGGAVATPRDPLAASPPMRRRSRRRRRWWYAAAACVTVLAGAWLAAPLVVPRPAEVPHEPPPERPPPDVGHEGGPAAATEPSPRTFVAGAWHNLLDQAPVKWHWFDPNFNSNAVYDAKLRRFRVQSLGTSLFSLGQASSPGYTIRIGFRQEQWTGTVGIFFAGKRDPATQALTYQYIDLGPGAMRGTLAIQRMRGSIQPRERQVPLLIEGGIDSWPLPQPPGPREYVLEMSVERAGLSRVAWDGIPCDALIDHVGRPGRGEQYHGEFGLFCQACSVQFLRAEYLPSE